MNKTINIEAEIVGEVELNFTFLPGDSITLYWNDEEVLKREFDLSAKVTKGIIFKNNELIGGCFEYE